MCFFYYSISLNDEHWQQKRYENMLSSLVFREYKNENVDEREKEGEGGSDREKNN